jgi:hypothetical protein
MSNKKPSGNSPKQRRVINLNRKVYGLSLKRLVALVLLIVTIGSIADIAYPSWTQNHTGNISPVGLPMQALTFVMCPVLNVQNSLMGELAQNSQCPQASQVTTQITFTVSQTTDPTASWSLSAGTGITIQLVYLSTIPCQNPMPTAPQNDQISSAGSLLNPALVPNNTYVYCIYYTSATTISAGTFTVTYAAATP